MADEINVLVADEIGVGRFNVNGLGFNGRNLGETLEG